MEIDESQMDNRIREGIEACRPASDDLSAQDLADVARAVTDDPEARQWFERIGRWDVAIGEAIEEVSVPEGLVDRIAARLQAEPAGAEHESPELLEGAVAAAAEPSASPDAHVEVRPPQHRPGWSRRHWAGATASAMVAAALVVMLGFWLNQDNDVPIEVLAGRWHDQLQNDAWEQHDFPKGFDIPAAVHARATRWQWIERIPTAPVVAYELVHETAGKAVLYVARMARPDLPSEPPSEPQHPTGGRTVAYWRSGGNVCVLVVPDQKRYPAFVQPPATTLAMVERVLPARRAA
ncbi:MAG: hypothetical protein DWQ37_10455 [Planctomycetota bacterium]|nr:MAG: hypothetical protein DWQ37_10455 [Planctomycetota bacterium]